MLVMIRIIVAIGLLVISISSLAEDIGDYEKLEECLSEFYQGRPRDYPPEAQKKEILVFKSGNGSEYQHTKQLRGMEAVCYKLFSLKK